ncbi:MAG: ribonuclease Z, partial [Desulfurococcales archaeon]|nr:ribonuclease Z [Desulfurococcales archaeon]
EGVNPVVMTFLGASGPYPGSDDLPSILVSSGRKHILLDAGEGVQHRLLDAGRSVTSVTHVLITHLHGDHVLGLLPLIQSRSLGGAETPLTVAGPKGLKDFLLDSFKHLMFAPSYELRVLEIGSRGELDLGGVKVAFEELIHSVPTVGYRLYFPGLSLCYVTDTRPSERAVKLCSGVDVLVHDAAFSCEDQRIAEEYMHSTVCEAAGIASEAEAKVLYLYHTSPRYRDPGFLLAQCRKVFKSCFLARKFMKVYLLPKMLKEI